MDGIEDMTEGALRHHLLVANARNVELQGRVDELAARVLKAEAQAASVCSAFTSLCDVLKMYGLGNGIKPKKRGR